VPSPCGCFGGRTCCCGSSARWSFIRTNSSWSLRRDPLRPTADGVTVSHPSAVHCILREICVIGGSSYRWVSCSSAVHCILCEICAIGGSYLSASIQLIRGSLHFSASPRHCLPDRRACGHPLIEDQGNPGSIRRSASPLDHPQPLLHITHLHLHHVQPISQVGQVDRRVAFADGSHLREPAASGILDTDLDG
jgi:hypothetical protein